MSAVRRALAHLRAAPAGMWVCFLVAFANAGVWALTTPSFQVPDEPVHAAYVQYLGETGTLPRPINTHPGTFDFSEEGRAAMEGVPFSHQGTPFWTRDAAEAAERRLSQPLGRKHEPGAGAAANYPPLYYAFQTVPYRLAHGASFYDRLLAMRLFSALLAGLTAAFTFLFVRELLPSTPWAWRCAGLAVALHPLFGFVGGGVNPDGGLWAASAALFWLVARAFSRGLTPARGAAIGAAIAAGLLTKYAAYAFAGAGAIALALLLWRSRAGALRPAASGALLAVACAAVPFAIWLATNTVAYERPVATATAGFDTPQQATFTGQLSYLWQSFLPPLPGMTDAFPKFSDFPLWIYFQGFVGRFGYFQWGFPGWVHGEAALVAVLVLALAAVALLRHRAAVRRRGLEAVTYVVLALATVTLVAVAAYRAKIAISSVGFEATRYLFPLLPLYGAVIALAARGAGRRYGRAVAVALVAAAATHNVYALLLSLERYYA